MMDGDPRSALTQALDDPGQLRDLLARADEERRALARQLEEKDEELQRYTYTVSHDLKSPLVTIQGFLGLIEKSAREGKLDRLRSDMARIDGAVDEMRQLLDQLLELSRIGRMDSPPVDVELGDLAREAVDRVCGPAGDRGVEVEIAPDLPVVHVDRRRLAQVLRHLVDNAVKFIGDSTEPRIEIGWRPASTAGEEPVFYVRDNGIGVDPKVHRKIFGLFVQLARGTPGTGVGLTLVKRIVELHGGRVWIESEGAGRGSCLCLTLPCSR